MNAFVFVGHITLGIFISIIGLILVAIIARITVANRIRRRHAITAPGGIEEEVVLSVGGIDQYLNIRGEDIGNPVILFLHGGPGGTMTSVLHAYQYPWEKEYTVVNWDQRIAGKTYFLNKKNAQQLASQLSVDLMLDDLHEIVLYLSERFGQQKIIMMGHSWGSVLGSRFALQYPELIQAFVGVGQTVHITDGMLKMAEYVRSLAETKHNDAHLAAIDDIVTRIKDSAVIPNTEAMELYQIAQSYMTVDMNTAVFMKALLTSPYYSLKELTYYGKQEQLTKPLLSYLLSCNLYDYGIHYKVPIIFLLGEKDWHNRITAEAYFNDVIAPYKKFILVKDAGHVAMLDQPERFYSEFSSALKCAFSENVYS